MGGRKQEEESHVSELIKPEAQKQPGKQPRFQGNRIGARVTELEPDNSQAKMYLRMLERAKAPAASG